MNRFGQNFRISVLGESHGQCVGVLLDGCPAGLSLFEADFAADLERRRGGRQLGSTTRSEPDLPLIKSGVFNGRTTGAPILIEVRNEDVQSQSYEEIKDTPRPGHADLVAKFKYGGFNDYRGGGHFSGRLTLSLVLAGVVAKKLIEPCKVAAKVTEVSGREDIEAAIESAVLEGDSVGGIVECRAVGLPIGLGEPFFDSVESLISHAVFAIPAVKGIEFGIGFDAAKLRGSEINDEILDSSGTTRTNNAGGINGGISNGQELVFRIAVKPTSTIKKSLQTVNLKTNEPAQITVEGRHDACIALRVPVVLEAVTAFTLLDLMLSEQRVPKVIKAG